MSSIPSSLARRHFMASIGSSLLLAACGGGSGDEADGDGIVGLRADRSSAWVGESVTLTAHFRHGTARIEPGLGTVLSGVPVHTPALDRDTTFELVVDTDAGTQRRTLSVPVRFRDRYVPAATPLSASLFALAPLPDGRVLVIGGSRGLGVVSDEIDVYEPQTHRVRRLTTLTDGRSEHRATVLPDGRVLVTGGLKALGSSERSELIEPALGRSVDTGPMSVPRVYHAAVALADGRVLVSGGMAAGEGPARPASDSAELWDPATGRFRRLAARMAMSRSSHTMTLLRDGRVLIAGGYTDRWPYVPFEVFDPVTETFEPLAVPGVLRANHAAHLDGVGRVLVLGGETAPAHGGIEPLVDVLRVDVATGQVTTLPSLLAPRAVAATVALPTGDVLLFGGETEPRRATASAERYDPVTGSRPIAPLDGARAWHGAARLPSGRVLVIGGEGPDGAYQPTVLAYG